jgi:hypothetical protein
LTATLRDMMNCSTLDGTRGRKNRKKLAQPSKRNAALLVIVSISARDDIESEMNESVAIHDGHRKQDKLRRRPIGVRSKRFHQRVLVGQQDDLQILWSPGEGSQKPVIKIGLDGERFCVRLFETEFEEVA